VGAGGDVGGDASCTFRCVTVVRRVGVPDERTESAEDYDTCRTATIPMQNYVFRECVQGADYSSFRQCVIDDDPIDDTCPPGPPAACEVGARECQGNSVSVCRIAADMTAAWQTEEACDPTLGCSDGYCNECLPGSSHCVETDNGPSPILLAWCVSDGEGYYETTASCASGSTCTPLDDPEAPLVRGTCVSW